MSQDLDWGTDRLLLRALELINDLEPGQLHCSKDRALCWLVYDVTGAPLLADAEAEGGRLRKRVTTGVAGRDLAAVEKAAMAEVRKAKVQHDKDGASCEKALADIAQAKETKLALLLD